MGIALAGYKDSGEACFHKKLHQWHLCRKGTEKMELRTAASPKDVKHYTTERLREEFLIQGLFSKNEIKLVYSHIDRIITGGAMPVSGPLTLTGQSISFKEEKWE